MIKLMNMKVIESNHFLIDVSLKKVNLASEYPFNLSVIKNLRRIIFHPNVTFIIGENGSGKSTLLEGIAIAMGLNAEGGSKNFNFQTKDTHSELHKYLRLTKGIKKPKDEFFFRAETFYALASEVEALGYDQSPLYGGKSLHKQSHGESYISLIGNRFMEKSLYILDEPEAALSPSNQLKFLALINKLVNKGSQFIIATHSPIILAFPKSDIYLFSESSIDKVSYINTPNYQITKYFLDNAEKMLSELLKTS